MRRLLILVVLLLVQFVPAQVHLSDYSGAAEPPVRRSESH